MSESFGKSDCNIRINLDALILSQDQICQIVWTVFPYSLVLSGVETGILFSPLYTARVITPNLVFSLAPHIHGSRLTNSSWLLGKILGGNTQMKRSGMLIGKFKLNP